MFKISYNSNGLRNLDPIQAIKEVTKYGYDGIELSFHPKHINPLNIDYPLLDSIKEALSENNLTLTSLASGCADLLSSVPYEPSLVSVTDEERNMRIRMMENCIIIAKYLNCPILSFASGFKPAELKYEEAYNNLIDGIYKLLNYSSDIILAIEPEPDMFIGTSTDAIKLIKDINNENFKLNLDIGHVNCCEDNYLEKIEVAIDYAVHCHIEDIKNRVHYHLIPGEGDIDFSSLYKKLSFKNYNKFLSVELYNHSDIWQHALESSLSYLKSIEVTNG